MILIYLFCFSLIPILSISSIHKIRKKEETILLNKNDTFVLRGVAALCVMIAHYITWFSGNHMNESYQYASLVLEQLGGIGVLIFFFVSGYGNYESYINKTPSIRYLKKRLLKVYVPYLIIKFILYFVEILCFGMQQNVVQAVIKILLVDEWFIKVIILEYLLFYFCWKYKRKDRIICYFVFANLLFSLFFYLINYDPRWYNSLWLFAVGMICSKYKDKINHIFKNHLFWKTIFLLGGFVLNGIFFAIYKDTMCVGTLFKSMSGIFLSLMLCLVLRKISIESVILIWLGKISMHLYIVHISVWLIIDADSMILKFWVSFVMSIILAFILYQFTERLAPKDEKK